MSMGGPTGGTRTLAQGRLKCVCKVTHPTYTLAQVEAWLAAEMALLESQPALAQMAATFGQDFAASGSPRVSEIINETGDFQLYPKIIWSGTPKKNTDTAAVVQTTVDALAVKFVADLEAAGFTVTQLSVKDYEVI